MTDLQVEKVADADALAKRAADWFLAIAAATPGRIAVCLSGGSTPAPLYALLATDHWRAQLPWPRLHWFFGDERFVPPDDPRSNFKMVQQALFATAPVPAGNIHPVPTSGLGAEAAAEAYAAELQRFHGSARLRAEAPLFDVNFLGLGADGHTASLFPGDAALNERDKWACAVAGARPEVRITLTRPVLESARHVAFLVAGAGKQPALAKLLARDATIPAARIEPVGDLRVFADTAALGAGKGQANG